MSLNTEEPTVTMAVPCNECGDEFEHEMNIVYENGAGIRCFVEELRLIVEDSDFEWDDELGILCPECVGNRDDE